VGSVIFSSGNVFGGGGGKVLSVNYNPADTGYRK
jgi:hypothetical protein